MRTWWDKNLPARLEDFKVWTGDANAPSRVAARKHVARENYQSILDCGCGLCVDAPVYRLEMPYVRWHGFDTYRAGGEDVTLGNMDSPLPFPSLSFDLVHCRHVLEHLPDYRPALAEMARVARSEVMVVWFLKPEFTKENLSYDAVENLHHNKYERKRMEGFLRGLRGARSIWWDDIGDLECIMHVHLH